jgi:SagB-type dehydrogenase family enzyme
LSERTGKPRDLQRSPFLILTWSGNGRVITNYRLRKTVDGTPLLLEILDFLGQRRQPGELAERFGWSSKQCAQLVTKLRSLGLVVQGKHHEVGVWQAWDPQAGFLHFSSRDTAFPTDVVTAEQEFLARERGTRGPKPCSSRRGRRVSLDSPLKTSVGAQLVRRRTWREFGGAKLTLPQLSTMLTVTFGVQHWARSTAGARVPLKTSPSGGACHPIEAYVAINGVNGVAPGLYHFDAARKDLVLLRRGMRRSTLQRYLPSQPWFWSAPAVVFLASVFERTIWRYPSPRSYRNVFLEAGHFAQSFCLLATELGLAPFCTHAFVDTAVEADLQLDGVNEGVVYAVGCGTRPTGGWRPGIPPTKEHR